MIEKWGSKNYISNMQKKYNVAFDFRKNTVPERIYKPIKIDYDKSNKASVDDKSKEEDIK